MLNRLKSILTNAKPEPVSDSGPLLNVYSTLSALPPLDFVHTVVARRDLSDPDLLPHLNGFIGYVLSRGDRQMTHTRYHLMRHLQQVQQHLSLRVANSAQPTFESWAMRANAVVFLEDGSVRDPQGRVLIDGNGKQDPAARIPYPPDASERKTRSEALLARRGLQVTPGLPPVVGAAEAQWRPPAEVAGRAMALLVVATYAESMRDGDPLGVAQLRERLPAAFDHLSPKEQAFLQMSEADMHTVNQMGWRYESLALLAWALGLLPELAYPEQICDVGGLCATLLQTATPAWLQQARLRPVGEMLDALDLHFRLHWLTREAELGRRELPPKLIPSVVLERHYALNWLVRFENAGWDDVDTPT